MQENKTRFYLIFAGLSAAFFLAAGATFASLGVVLPAMIETLRWSWAEAGLGFTTLALFTGLFSPVAAESLKRLGLRGNYAAGGAAMASGSSSSAGRIVLTGTRHPGGGGQHGPVGEGRQVPGRLSGL
mgnify:CR=1 FL=1